MTPVVSVLIPTRNRATLLGRAIDSVLAQTYTNWEIVIINDQSTDNTAEVIAAYQAKDRRIHGVVGNRESSGLARNVGFQSSQGRYLALLDDDDTWLPEKLAAQVDVVERNPAVGVVFTDSVVMRGAEVLKPVAVPKANPAFKRWLLEHPPTSQLAVHIGPLDRALWFINPITLSTALIRRDLYVTAGGFRKYKGGEGYDLWLRISPLAPFAFIDQILARYEMGVATTMGPWESRSYRTREFDLNALEGNFANVPPDLRGTIRSRMAECARLSGWHRLRVGERAVARKLLVKSLRYKWRQPKVVAYLAAAFLPFPVLRVES